MSVSASMLRSTIAMKRRPDITASRVMCHTPDQASARAMESGRAAMPPRSKASSSAGVKRILA